MRKTAMLVHPWLKSLRSKLLSKSQVKRGSKVWRPYLQLEWLEQRLTPATYNWDGVDNLTISLATSQSLTVLETGGTVTFRVFDGFGANFTATNAHAAGNATSTITFGTTQIPV